MTMRSVVRSLTVLGGGLLVAATAMAQKSATPPAPDALLKRACDAAGGLEAFNRLGILAIASKSEEVSQEGEVTTTLRTNFFAAPGPLPGRFEYPEKKVVAADDGTGGWAVINQMPDSRFGTKFKVQRSLATTLFPMLLPFSLTWKDVTLQGVKPAQLDGRPVWQLAVELPRNFFESPQISTSWTVSFDRSTGLVVRAESPFTDLGKGVTADGMRYTRMEPVKVGGVTFYKQQKVAGLDEVGQEKIHNRIDHLQYHVVPATEATKLFANPIPPDQRPKPPKALQAPPNLPQPNHG
jgi:hypothetical protein